MYSHMRIEIDKDTHVRKIASLNKLRKSKRKKKLLTGSARVTKHFFFCFHTRQCQRTKEQHQEQ